MRHLLTGLCFSAAMAVAVSSANAVTISYVSPNTQQAWVDAFNSQPTSDSTAGGSWVGTAPQVVSGSQDGIYRSPFDGSTAPSGAIVNPHPNVANLGYFTVGPDPNTTSPATLKFNNLNDGFSFLWGSIDDYNKLEFFNGATKVAEVLWSALIPPGIATYGASFVQLWFPGSERFDSVRFSASQNAFEFSNINVTPVPLPASVLLLLSGLGGVGLLSRLRARFRSRSKGDLQAAMAAA